MADNLSKANRIKNMSAIRSVSKLEDNIAKTLWIRGFRFRRNVRDMFGNPDISIKKYKLVVFIDSCYWHGCELHGNMPKSNIEYWANKLERNKKRDLIVNDYYRSKDWNILRLWEHEFKKPDFQATIDQIASFIEEAKSK
jgi:DNA mismatch endonuclease (patch repair protein)